MIKAEQKNMFIAPMKGLEIESSDVVTPQESFRRLENLWLFRSGAIQRAGGFSRFGLVSSPSPIVETLVYRRTPTDPRQIIAIASDGTIFDVETGAVLGNIPNPAAYPFVGLMPGTFIDTTIQYLVTTTQDKPMKWESGASSTSDLGIAAPVNGLTAIGLLLSDSEQNSVNLVVGRRYRYTFWNPITRHESSPSPDIEANNPLDATTPYTSTIGPSAFLSANDAFPFIRSVLLRRVLEAPGNGYTHFRVYATRDGSTEFFLVNGLVGSDIDQALTFPANTPPGHYFTADDDGSLPTSVVAIWDGTVAVPLPSGLLSENVYYLQGPEAPSISISQDQSYVGVAPLPGENDPAPEATWGTIYQGRLWLVTKDDPSKLVFSKIGDFQSFPQDNFFSFTIDDSAPITALVSEYQQLLIGKRGSTSLIRGTDFSNFFSIPIDPQVGFVGKRLYSVFEGKTYFMSKQGIMSFADNVPTFEGRSIRPLTDTLDAAEANERLQSGYCSKRGIIAFVFNSNADDIDSLILLDRSEEMPFTTLTGFTGTVDMLKEIEDPEGLSCMPIISIGGKVYTLFSGDDFDGQQMISLAETQKLPVDDYITRKTFRRLKAKFIGDWEYSFSIDDSLYSDWMAMRGTNPLGQSGKQIQIRFRCKQTSVFTPFIDGYDIEYATIGESR